MNRTRLDQHRRHRKTLQPPLRTLTTHNFVHWYPNELPDYLWLCVLFQNEHRQATFEALRSFFEEVSTQRKASKTDVDFYSLSRLSQDSFDRLIGPFFKNKSLARALSALSLLPDFPSKRRWEKHFIPIDREDAFRILLRSVGECQYQQSQQATDVGFVIYYTALIRGRIHLAQPIADRQEPLLRNYPRLTNYDEIGGGIRAARNMLFGMKERTARRSAWAERFWEWGQRWSDCKGDPFNSQKEPSRISSEFIDHIFKLAEYITISSSKNKGRYTRDIQFETMFGLIYYVISLTVDCAYSPNKPAPLAVMALRSAAEAAISLTQLSKNPASAVAYREYGLGKAKLSSLKLDEMADHPRSVARAELLELANDDGWEEYVEVNFGSQFGAPIRDIASDLGMAEFYDKYFNWQSAFVHAEWGAVRASVYERCLNPLHEWHLIPSFRVGGLKSVLFDLVEILELMIRTVADADPTKNHARALRILKRARTTLK